MPRKITETVVTAFLQGRACHVANSAVILQEPVLATGVQHLAAFADPLKPDPKARTLVLHGNAIAAILDGALWVSLGGYGPSNTTKERLSALPGVSVYTRKFEAFLDTPDRDAAPWDGKWCKVGTMSTLGRPYWLSDDIVLDA